MRCAVHTSVGEWTVDRVDQVGGAHRSTHQYDDWGSRLRAFGDRPCNVVAVLGLFDACMSDGDAEAPRAWARARSDLARHAVAEALLYEFQQNILHAMASGQCSTNCQCPCRLAALFVLRRAGSRGSCQSENTDAITGGSTSHPRAHTNVLGASGVNCREFDQHNSNLFCAPINRQWPWYTTHDTFIY
jgi:hypothetical protein